MLAFKEWLVNTLVNDPTLQSYLTDQNGHINVFPVDIDVQPEQFPCIIFQDAGIQVLSRPQGMHVGSIQLDIYSLNNSLEMEQIYDRVAQLLNFKDSTTESLTGTLWWIRENAVRDIHDSERRLWRKTVDFKIWYNTSTNT